MIKYFVVPFILLLLGCGFKPHANCVPPEKPKEETQTILDQAKECVKQPTVGVTKEF